MKLTRRELNLIREMRRKDIDPLFNKKGHLVIYQRYPYLPLIVSLIALTVSIVIMILKILK